MYVLLTQLFRYFNNSSIFFLFLQNGLHEWHIIFWIGAAVYAVCGFLFVVLGSGTEQSWNQVEDKKLDDVKGEVNGIENAAFDNGTDVKDSNLS